MLSETLDRSGELGFSVLEVEDHSWFPGKKESVAAAGALQCEEDAWRLLRPAALSTNVTALTKSLGVALAPSDRCGSSMYSAFLVSSRDGVAHGPRFLSFGCGTLLRNLVGLSPSPFMAEWAPEKLLCASCARSTPV